MSLISKLIAKANNMDEFEYKISKLKFLDFAKLNFIEEYYSKYQDIPIFYSNKRGINIQCHTPEQVFMCVKRLTDDAILDFGNNPDKFKKNYFDAMREAKYAGENLYRGLSQSLLYIEKRSNEIKHTQEKIN